MTDPRELLKEVLAEVSAERAAQTSAVVAYTKEFRKLWDQEIGAPLASNWYTSVKTLYSKGLSDDELYDSVMVTGAATVVSSAKFRYFCGVANTKMKQRDADALNLLADTLTEEPNQ